MKPIDFRHAQAALCGIDPIEYKVLILPKKAEAKTKGGIVLPDEVLDRDQHAAVEGEIIKVSPFAFSYEEWPKSAAKPQAGDTAIFARFSGATVKGNDGVEYRLMNDKDVMAVRRGA